MYSGALLVVFGLGLLHASNHGYEFASSSRVMLSILYASLLTVAGYSAGLPEATRTLSGAYISSALAAVAAIAFMSVIQLALAEFLLPRTVLLGSAVTVTGWFGFCSGAAIEARKRALGRERVLFVGDEVEAKRLREDLALSVYRPVTLVGSVEPTDEALGRVSPVKVSPSSKNQAEANIIVLSAAAQANKALIRDAALLHAQGVRIRTLAGFYEEWLGKLPASELERLSLLFDISEVHGSSYRHTKRMLDTVVGSFFLLVFFSAVPLVLIGNLLGNRGKLFYRQPRVGKRNMAFDIIKFRTMIPGPTKDAKWTMKDDPRITPFGKILRRTHIDELPQAINLLRGELSIVGPRPEQPHYVEQLRQVLPFYELRHLIRPGLTGWAQVNYGYAADEDDALEKLEFEFFYLQHQSLWFDCRIIARTLRSVLRGAGR